MYFSPGKNSDGGIFLETFNETFQMMISVELDVVVFGCVFFFFFFLAVLVAVA